MASFQDQFLKAGLVDKNKVKQANQDKSKQMKVERRTGTQSVDEVRLAALETQRKNAERARELNAQRDAAATHKAIVAQIAQMGGCPIFCVNGILLTLRHSVIELDSKPV